MFQGLQKVLHAIEVAVVQFAQVHLVANNSYILYMTKVMVVTTVSTTIVTTMRILMAVSVKSYSWMYNDNCEDCTLYLLR